MYVYTHMHNHTILYALDSSGGHRRHQSGGSRATQPRLLQGGAIYIYIYTYTHMSCTSLSLYVYILSMCIYIYIYLCTHTHVYTYILMQYIHDIHDGVPPRRQLPPSPPPPRELICNMYPTTYCYLPPPPPPPSPLPLKLTLAARSSARL